MATLDSLSITTIQDYLFRNIVSLRESQDLYDDLSDDPSDWELATQVELQFKPPQYESHQPIIDRPFEEADYTNAIQYVFNNWSYSRFSTGNYGVWYGSKTLETTIHETLYHWQNRLLNDADLLNYKQPIIMERKIYQVYCDAGLINLLGKETEWPWLLSNDYSECQSFGQRVHQQGFPGLWTPSARHEGGINAAVFNARVLSQPKNHCYLQYEYCGGELEVFRGDEKLTLCV